MNENIQSKITDWFSFACQHPEADQSVGTVTSLQVQETLEVVRVTWVGVQGATAYRVSWRRTDGAYFSTVAVGTTQKQYTKMFSQNERVEMIFSICLLL